MSNLPRHVPPRRPRNLWESIRDAGFTGLVFFGVVGLVGIWLVLMGVQFLIALVAG